MPEAEGKPIPRDPITGEPPPSEKEAATRSPERGMRILGLWITERRAAIWISLLVGLALVWSALPFPFRSALVRAALVQRSIIFLMLVFGLLIISLLWNAGQRLDAYLFLLLNVRGEKPHHLDRLMFWLTQIGNGAVGLSAAGLLYLAGEQRLAVELVIGILTLWLTVETVKALTDRPRPFLALKGARVVGWHERGRSFPSGHTSQSFFMAALLTHYYQPPLWGALLIYTAAFAVAFTRMYVGAHYPRDVLAGGILGTLWGLLLALLDSYWVVRG